MTEPSETLTWWLIGEKHANVLSKGRLTSTLKRKKNKIEASFLKCSVLSIRQHKI